MIHFYDLETEYNPVDLFNIIRNEFSNCFLLESMEGPDKFATQSVLGFDPIHLVRIENNQMLVDGMVIASGLEDIKQEFLGLLQNYQVNDEYTKQFTGGLVGFTSYDMIRYIEDLPSINEEDHYPDALYGMYLDGIRYDHNKHTLQYFYHENAPSRLSEITDLVSRKTPSIGSLTITNLDYRFPKEKFKNAVKTIREGIIAGETFQTVLSQRINFDLSGDHLVLYQKLRKINPSPYMFYLDFDPYVVIGSSPELLVSIEQKQITTYPIAGTRPLSENEEQNQKLAAELRNDEKEKAEHNMLVDLARNDIGMIAKFDTVEVTEYMEVEYFSHVMHLVSKVEGEIQDNLNMFDAFYSTFPAGTVSGAPKIRSMELIEELEPVRRGPYAGSVGYFGINFETVQAITIRSAFSNGENFSIQAGAGIVLDSDPQKEYEETLHKLAALLEIIRE